MEAVTLPEQHIAREAVLFANGRLGIRVGAHGEGCCRGEYRCSGEQLRSDDDGSS
jgi:Fe-S cluster assembly iron-binding protein IscA